MKRKFFLLGALALIVAGGIFWSCQKEELLNPEEGLDLKKAKVSTMQTGNQLLWDDPVCTSAEHTFTFNFPQRTTPNGKELESEAHVELKLNGEWMEITDGEVGNTSVVIYYTFNDPGTYEIRYKTTGSWDENDIVSVEVVDCTDCEDEFTLADVSECNAETRYAEFLFVAGEDGEVKIQGGLTNGADVVSSEIWLNDIQLMEGDIPVELNYGVTAGHVHNWIGTLHECDKVIIKLSWTATQGTGEEMIDEWTVERDGITVGTTPPSKCK